MSERKGVLLLMFDLPMVTAEDRREYYHFKKNLRQKGFVQLQESCYLKLIRNISSMEAVMRETKHFMPKNGNVSILPMNASVFSAMRCMCGEPFDIQLFTGDVLFIGDDESCA